jgi:hypothetical protein
LPFSYQAKKLKGENACSSIRHCGYFPRPRIIRVFFTPLPSAIPILNGCGPKREAAQRPLFGLLPQPGVGLRLVAVTKKTRALWQHHYFHFIDPYFSAIQIVIKDQFNLMEGLRYGNIHCIQGPGRIPFRKAQSALIERVVNMDNIHKEVNSIGSFYESLGLSPEREEHRIARVPNGESILQELLVVPVSHLF